MKSLPYDLHDRIAALATPRGTAALAVIRTSGPGCVDAVGRLFDRPGFSSAPGGSAHHGVLVDPASGLPIDEVVLLVQRAPRSYTGQESVEITCHGSMPGVDAILDALRRLGFRDARPGEFTLRAFLNGKVDLTRAEAVREIVESKSREAHAFALNRLSGAVEQRIDAQKRRLLSVVSAVSLFLDYPEDEVDAADPIDLATIDAVLAELESLAATYRIGRLYQEGARVAIAGRTNAGKSSLFNLFLRQDRSIVSEAHGTTRDYIESWITIAGLPIALFDTAGLREGGGPLEAEGIRRARQVVDAADVVIYLIDGVAGPDETDREFLRRRPGCIVVWSKADSAVLPPPEGAVALSSRTGAGFAELESRIASRLASAESAVGEVIIDSARQKDLIDRCVDALRTARRAHAEGYALDAVATDLQAALDALGEITGEVTSADILENLFSRFCVGK